MSGKIESGLTAFATSPALTYRYVISNEAEKLKITLEDTKSKKQWSSGFLDDKEYITNTNRIPNASLTDYVKVFKDTLEYLMEDENSATENNEDLNATSAVDSGKIRRQLTHHVDGTVQLDFAIKIRIFQSAWTAKYQFHLNPLTLDRVDILEAKLREVENELRTSRDTLIIEKQERARVVEELCKVKDRLTEMETALAEVQDAQNIVRLHAVSKNVAELNEKGQIVWNSLTGFGFESSKDGYGVRILTSGWYVLNATIYLAPQISTTNVEIQVNGKYLRSQPAPCTVKHNCSVTFAFTKYLNKADELTILITGFPFKVGADLHALRVALYNCQLQYFLAGR